MAIKIKRAIRFPYLDYSTVEKRRAACNEELEINRTFAPQLYRRVVPITREPDGAFRYDGTGEPVEWAVEMVRFDENQTLDCIADRGEFGLALAGKLGAAIGVLQERAPVADATAWLSAIEQFVDRNTLAFREILPCFPATTSRNSIRPRGCYLYDYVRCSRAEAVRDLFAAATVTSILAILSCCKATQLRSMLSSSIRSSPRGCPL